MTLPGPVFITVPFPYPIPSCIVAPQPTKTSVFAPLPTSQAMVSADDADSDADAMLCDFCASEPAVVYCRADSARLCLACDREVHAANTVSTRHNRSLLCDCCSSAAAAIFCPSLAHRSVLCSNCDFDAHHADAHHHARKALDPFSGCPSGVSLAAVLGVADEKDSVSSKAEEGWDWEVPAVFCWEDLILLPTATPFHGYQATGSPPPPKDSNSSCGRRKEEIRRQIRQLIAGESDMVDYKEDSVPVMELNLLPAENLQLHYSPTHVFIEEPSCEQASCINYNLNHSPTVTCNPAAASCQLLTESPAPACCDNDCATLAIQEKLPLMPLKVEVLDRSSLISRYKEKRKTRRYDKLIRYESRKARADSRVRIKGRFAKANQVTAP